MRNTLLIFFIFFVLVSSESYSATKNEKNCAATVSSISPISTLASKVNKWLGSTNGTVWRQRVILSNREVFRTFFISDRRLNFAERDPNIKIFLGGMLVDGKIELGIIKFEENKKEITFTEDSIVFAFREGTSHEVIAKHMKSVSRLFPKLYPRIEVIIPDLLYTAKLEQKTPESFYLFLSEIKELAFVDFPSERFPIPYKLFPADLVQ